MPRNSVASLPRAAYADMFGPTKGDRVRLADTDLIIEVEKARYAKLPFQHTPPK